MPDRDLISECAEYLALTVSELLAISATAPRRYYVWKVNKRSGVGQRLLCHPARELKAVQRYFLDYVLNNIMIHDAATAYVPGSSIKKNALVHLNSRVVLKLDFSDFFNSLRVKDWRKYAADAFPTWTESDLDFSCQILFWGDRTSEPKCLAIGASTSPIISNALLFDFDEKLNLYASNEGLSYTRYADDITISSTGYLDRDRLIGVVNTALAEARYCELKLNPEKTCLVTTRFCRRVTGLVITPDRKISLGRTRKRLISVMVHHAKKNSLPPESFSKLAGLLAFAKDVEPTFIKTLERKYSAVLIRDILSIGTASKRISS